MNADTEKPLKPLSKTLAEIGLNVLAGQAENLERRVEYLEHLASAPNSDHLKLDIFSRLSLASIAEDHNRLVELVRDGQEVVSLLSQRVAKLEREAGEEPPPGSPPPL